MNETVVETEAPILWPPDWKSPLIGKSPDAGKDWGQEETEDGMVSITDSMDLNFSKFQEIVEHTEKAMAPHSSTLAWKIPWTEEPGGLQSMGSLRIGQDWAISLSLFTFMHWRRKQCSCLENLRDGGACWAAVYGVAQSRTRLKRLSSSSSSSRAQKSLTCCSLWGPKESDIT